MNPTFELGDFVYAYPDGDRPDIQTQITGRKEFAELASSTTEPVPAPGTPYKHQRLIRRYMFAYDRLLLMHRAGTGKSCAFFDSAELFRAGMMAAAIDFGETYIRPQRTNIRRIFVFTKGPGLIAELRKQLICRCTPGTYLTPGLTSSVTERQQNQAANTAIQPYYTLTTYGTFANHLDRQQLSDDQLRYRYSDSYFIIDEVQNVHPDPSSQDEDSRLIYATFHRLFHVAERTKILLATATPMINDVTELRSTLNLLLPMERQMPPEFDLNNCTLTDLEPYVRGLISFVRELETGAVPIEIGERLQGSYTIGGRVIPATATIYPTSMSAFQSSVYQHERGTGRAPFNLELRESATFVFPDGGTNQASFNRYIDHPRADIYLPRPELVEAIQTNGVQMYSCKYDAILRLTIGRPGICWVYSDLLNRSGAGVLAALYTLYGAIQYASNTSAFLRQGSSVARPYCGTTPEDVQGNSQGEHGDQPTLEETDLSVHPNITTEQRRSSPLPQAGNRPMRIEPALRFALISGDTPAGRLASILELATSKENVDGSYLKIILGAPAARIGLNLANVVQIHLAGGSWNQANVYQAISRGIRTTSHEYLLARRRQAETERLFQDLQAEGLDPATALTTARERAQALRVEIEIYRHAAIALDGDSIDVRLYRLSEEKDVSIRRVERLLKQAAIDCQIHHARNVHSDDLDGSPPCDYDVCNYPCVSPAPTHLDLSSYQVLYLDERLPTFIEHLRTIFAREPILSFDQLQSQLQSLDDSYQPEDILLLLERVISSRTTLLNRYGITSYLNEADGVFFLDRNYPSLTPALAAPIPPTGRVISSVRSLSYYSRILIGATRYDLATAAEPLQETHQNDLIDSIQQAPPETIPALWASLDITHKVFLFETIFEDLVMHPETPPQAYAVAILEINNGNWYQFHEPINAILQMAGILARRGTGRGRKPTSNRPRRLNPEAANLIQAFEAGQIQEPPVTDVVYLHTIYNQRPNLVAYTASIQTRQGPERLRLLKPGQPWRDATIEEDLIYHALIRSQVNSLRVAYEAAPIYGIISRVDRQFRIRDKTTEAPGALTDTKQSNRGLICQKWPKPELIDLCWKVGLEPPVPPVEADRTTLLNYLRANHADTPYVLIDTYDDAHLAFLARWYQSGYTVRQICDHLQTFFGAQNLLLVE